jgi:hypothetical protein
MLRKFFYYIYSKLTIVEIYSFQGTQEDIEDVLQQLLQTNYYGFKTNYYVSKGSRQYHMTSNWSWGTLRLTGFAPLPIKIYFDYQSLSVREQEVRIFTRVRPENVFLLFVMCFMGIVVSANDPDSSIWLLLLSICIGIFFVSNFFYKLQEHALIKDVRKTIGLKFVSKY